MKKEDVLPELKQIIGALLFGAKEPVTAGRIKGVLARVAEKRGGAYRDFAKATEKDIKNAIADLRDSLESSNTGVTLTEVQHGFRLENDSACGPWLRELLNRGKTSRLSRPALETLAIIAYRQPVSRGEIEAVRGVAVDAIIRNLLELQLIKAVGRSELPGRPWLFGTTSKFMEHFGLKHLNELPGVDELKRVEKPKEEEKDEEEPPVEEKPESGKKGAAKKEEEEEPAEEAPPEEEATEEAEVEEEELDDEGEDEDQGEDEEFDDEDEDEEEFEDDDEDEDDD
ncbi:MAG: SMC-Scp complex subunit ScpB [Verrucomicrobiota bacterium]